MAFWSQVMNEVGILTLHHQVNYGGVLQAYATQQACRKLGYDAELVDFRFHCSPDQALDEASDWNGMWNRLRRTILCGFARTASMRRRSTRSFMQAYMQIDRRTCQDLPALASLTGYDRLLVGSDQVWNPHFFSAPNPFLLPGAFSGAKSAYASSIGVADIPSERRDEYASAWKEFRFISVRERTAADIVERTTGFRPPEALDPTLLLTSEEWCRSLDLTEGDDGSVFCYWLGSDGRLFPLLRDLVVRRKQVVKLVMFWPERLSVRQAAQRLPLRSLLALHPRVKVLFGAGPREFLSALISSSYVLGTSFHSLMFATLFKKKARICLNNSSPVLDRSSRIVDFCNRHGLNVVLSREVPIAVHGTGSDGFAPIDIDLSDERERSLQILKDALA